MKWLLLLPINIIVTIAAFIFAPFMALYDTPRWGSLDNGNKVGYGPRLPDWLSWFQTKDNSLDGDEAWMRMDEDHWGWRSKLPTGSYIQSYLGRLGWLWRNPAQGFERASYVAANISSDNIVQYKGNPFIKDKPNGVAGYCYITIDNFWSHHYWCLYAIIRLGSTRCIKLKFGWNLKTYAEKGCTDSIAPMVFSVTFPSFIE